MSEQPPDSSETFRWLAFAREDLEFGRLGMDRFPRSAAWSFQQAAEKALKAMLLLAVLPVPRSHDVGYLLTLVEAKRAKRVPEAVRSAVLELLDVTAAGRYPDDELVVTSDDCGRYCAAAGIVVDWAYAEAGGP